MPDHQENFLSPRTLSNIIFEINQRVSQEEALSVLQEQAISGSREPNSSRGDGGLSGSATAVSQETVDKAAALYHLQDVRDEEDTLEVIVPPQPVHLGRFNRPKPAPTAASPPPRAYSGVVSFTTKPELERKVNGVIGPGSVAAGRIPVSVDGFASAASLQGPKTSRMTCHYLLVRLEKQETDLVVFFNVPHAEFDLSGDPRGLSQEEELASDTIKKLAEQLEVKDWDLFVQESM